MEFVNLWTRLQSVELRPGVPDQIEWKLSAHGEYSTKSAYMVQFLGAMDTNLDQLIWKAWAPPKCKIFAWLAYQNRLWTADRLEQRGWPNQKKCPLCRHTDESALHLFAQCRYTRRLWTELGASVPTQSQIWLHGILVTAQPNGGRWQVLRLNCHLRRCDRFCCSFLGKFGMRGMEESSDTKSPRS